jgi:hypothetical protein
MSTLPPGGPIQDYRHQHSATAVGPLVNVDIATRWAHSGLSMRVFGGGCGPISECRHCHLVGPFRIIDIDIRRRLRAHSQMSTPPLRWAHSGSSTSLLAGGCGPISECRHCYSVGPCRIIDIIIRRRLWAHSRTSTVLLGGPIQDYRHHHLATAVDPHVNVDIATR